MRRIKVEEPCVSYVVCLEDHKENGSIVDRRQITHSSNIGNRINNEKIIITEKEFTLQN